MGTEILRPQNCFSHPIMDLPSSVSRRQRACGSSKANNRNTDCKSKGKVVSRQRRSSVQPSRSDDKRTAKGPVMETVKILKRGETLESKIECEMKKKENVEPVVCGGDRSRRTTDMKPKQRSSSDFKSPMAGFCDTYAGWGFFMSPEPSSLPLPSFSKSKTVMAVIEESASSDLRRILRLDA